MQSGITDLEKIIASDNVTELKKALSERQSALSQEEVDSIFLFALTQGASSDILKTLISNISRINRNIVNANGNSAFMLVAMQSSDRNLLGALATESNIKYENNGRNTLFMVAQEGKDERVIPILIKNYNFNPNNSTDLSGNTALMAAITRGGEGHLPHYTMIDTLLRYPNLDINAKNKAGETALDLLDKKGDRMHHIRTSPIFQRIMEKMELKGAKRSQRNERKVPWQAVQKPKAAREEIVESFRRTYKKKEEQLAREEKQKNNNLSGEKEVKGWGVRPKSPEAEQRRNESSSFFGKERVEQKKADIKRRSREVTQKKLFLSNLQTELEGFKHTIPQTKEKVFKNPEQGLISLDEAVANFKFGQTTSEEIEKTFSKTQEILTKLEGQMNFQQRSTIKSSPDEIAKFYKAQLLSANKLSASVNEPKTEESKLNTPPSPRRKLT